MRILTLSDRPMRLRVATATCAPVDSGMPFDPNGNRAP